MNRRHLLSAGMTAALVPALGGTGNAAASAPAPGRLQSSPATVLRSEQFELKSAAGTTYIIRVAKPLEIEPNTSMIRDRKPVAIYVLDGATNFGLVTDIARMMQGGGDLPPCLIVGVDYPDVEVAADHNGKHRGFDFTPTARAHLVDSKLDYPGGGAGAFLAFLRQDVRRLITTHFDVDPGTSVLYGHSYGGLFAISAVSQDEGAFTHYLSLSPSLWWDNRFELFRLRKSLEGGLRKPGRLAVFIGEREEREAGLAASMVGNVVALRGILDAHSDAFASTLIEVLPNEDHFTLHGLAVSKGLRFLLT